MTIANVWARMRDAEKAGILTGVGPFRHLYIDVITGLDGNNGENLVSAVKTWDRLYSLLTAAKNNVGVIVGNGAASGSVRLTAATTFNKAATHLKGECSPSLFSPRARIAAPTTGAAFANFLTIQSSGSVFENLQFWNGFASDGNNQITITLSGSQNVFKNCHIAGITKGSDAGARCLKISGSENFFEDCVIGVDTVDRSAANASIEFSGGSARNIFRNCIFPIRATATSPLAVIVSAAAASDRFQVFENCIFWNHGTATMTALATLAANMGGYLLFKDCVLARTITGYGTDATSRGQIFVVGPAASNVTGVAVAPNA